MSGRLVACIPARNEAERLPILLDALAQQTLPDIAIVIALNNTTDESLQVLKDVRSRHPALDVVVDETHFAKADAHAGSARKRAMDAAADLAGPGGFVVTTDADARPPPDWLANNMAAMMRGLDIAGGFIVVDEYEPMPEQVARSHSLAGRYWARVREIEDAIDPVSWDPPPRHGDHTGASLCITVEAYRRCGGVPAIRTSEDRALVKAAALQGARLAHPIDIWTRVSPRLIGRASGGMAEHMQQLHARSEAQADVMFPSFAQWRARAAWRRDIRKRGGAALVVELEDTLPPMVDDMVLSPDAFEPAA
ncbi:MAG: glycosyltransferase family A protein [Hyphomicrobiales bacterium]|nr:glycosyltransferase family A protein [Hyphomicrobiales bacterium]